MTGVLLILSVIVAPTNALFRKKKKLARVKAGREHKEHDPIHVVVNKVGPFNNPMETYRFYSLPYCKTHALEENEVPGEPDNADGSEDIPKGDFPVQGDRLGAERFKQRLGETIAGDHRETSPYEITFMDEAEFRVLCITTLSPQDVQAFKEAIHNDYYFEMFIDDLPMWGYIGEIVGEDALLGEIEGSKTYLYTHLHFKLGYNKGRIVSAELSTRADLKYDITNDKVSHPVKFTYSVAFEASNLEWKDRFKDIHETRFLPKSFEIHWLSIINSFVLVLLLTAFLTIIMMRVLKNDLSRYMEVDDEALDEEESGWKLIHGDVFRFPERSALFCAMYGAGIQLLCASFFLLTLALGGIVSTTRRGSILAGIVVLYCLTSFIGGYVSSRMYRRMGGKNWVKNTCLTATVFPLPVVIVFAYVNTIAWAYRSTQALPAGTVALIAALYLLLSFPLTLLGSIMAKHLTEPNFNAPTRTTKVQRQIPSEIPWFKQKWFQVMIAGFLPFSAIYIELNYIFASIWGHQIYTLFGILLFALVLLVIVTSFITIALLYFQLAREDHKWWWTTFVNGGSTGIFIFVYSWFYYFHRSDMKGILQGSFYFGYMFIISYAFFLLLGACSFGSSLLFVRAIYSRLKID